MTKIFVSGGKATSASRTHYIATTKLTKEEGISRKLFSDSENSLSGTNAKNYLLNNSNTDVDLIELVLSLEKKDFEKLGINLKTRIKSMREAVREGVNNLWKELGVKDVRWAAGIHLNTANEHAHIVSIRNSAGTIQILPTPNRTERKRRNPNRKKRVGKQKTKAENI